MIQCSLVAVHLAQVTVHYQSDSLESRNKWSAIDSFSMRNIRVLAKSHPT